jgi:hypothetical protein
VTLRQLASPELLLLVDCCRWNFPSAKSLNPLAIPDGLNWSDFLSAARRHRVQGLAWNALAEQADQLSSDAREALSADARWIAATNLSIARECRELLAAFQQANVPLLFVKGLTVGVLAYRTPMMKMGWDIDVLIDPEDLDVAASLLSQQGYAVRLPQNPAELQPWHSRSKESVWSRDRIFHVELHSRLADNRRLIPAIDVHSPRQFVDIAPAISLPTLASGELFAYLTVHGASSAWFRLKWISDFAALLHRRDAAEMWRLYSQSQTLGAGRAAAQALLLADALFNSMKSAPDLRDHLSSDPAAKRLCRVAVQMLVDGREPTEHRLGTLPIHWTQLLLRPDLRFKLSELWRQAGSQLNRSN